MIMDKSIELLYAKVLSEISHGVILIDSTQKIFIWNNWLFQHSKINSENAVGKFITDIFPEINLNLRLKTGIEWCLESGKYTIISERFGLSPLPLYSENEKRINPRIILSPIQFENKFFCCIEIYDSSSYLAKENFARGQTRMLKDTQTTLVETSKLAALGEMAGGIAHEINTPLGAILLRANQIKRMLEKSPESLEKVIEFSDVIISICQKIESIIKGLRHFARSSENDPFTKNKIIDIINDTIALCSARMQENNVEIMIEGNFNDLEIDCRPSQISQVLLNLLSNAQHALINLTENKWIKISLTVEEEFIQIKIIDNGAGISENIANKIFQPFFTTKEIGVGTGLGLSISRGIIKDHGGDLFLDRKEKNTVFVIKLPKIQIIKKK
jgi:signal transduction histidine kinase